MELRPRIYVDTSAIGGCFEPEFRIGSERLFRRFVEGRATLVLSELTLLELSRAPEVVRQVLAEIPSVYREDVVLTTEVADLAQAYLQAGALNQRQQADVLHIAPATCARVDVLVSWNFKHIVNLQRIHGFNAVNLLRGYPLLEIRTPLEVVADEDT